MNYTCEILHLFYRLVETESQEKRVQALKDELDKLPYENYEMLDIIMHHLKK